MATSSTWYSYETFHRHHAKGHGRRRIEKTKACLRIWRRWRRGSFRVNSSLINGWLWWQRPKKTWFKWLKWIQKHGTESAKYNERESSGCQSKRANQIDSEAVRQTRDFERYQRQLAFRKLRRNTNPSTSWEFSKAGCSVVVITLRIQHCRCWRKENEQACEETCQQKSQERSSWTRWRGRKEGDTQSRAQGWAKEELGKEIKRWGI